MVLSFPGTLLQPGQNNYNPMNTKHRSLSTLYTAQIDPSLLQLILRINAICSIYQSKLLLYYHPRIWQFLQLQYDLFICRQRSRSEIEERRLSIMDYGAAGEGGGCKSPDRPVSSRRASFTGEQADLDFLHQQQEDSLIPLKEDLADWLNKLLGEEEDELLI